MMPPFLTTEELAARWRKSPESIRIGARSKEIPGIKLNRSWRFDLEEIAAYEDRRRRRDPMSMTPAAARRRGLRSIA